MATLAPHLDDGIADGPCRLRLALAAFFLGGTAVFVRGRARVDVLRVGTSISLTGDTKGKKEGSARETLKSFIKEEPDSTTKAFRKKTGVACRNMAKGQLHLGVFEGYEFAWAQENIPSCDPWPIAVNVYKYPVGYVVALRTNTAKDFAGLEGQSLAIPTTGPHFLKLFVEHECEASKKKTQRSSPRSPRLKTSRTLWTTSWTVRFRQRWSIAPPWGPTCGASRADSSRSRKSPTRNRSHRR